MEASIEAPTVIELVQNARPPIPWTLSLYPDRWVFETAGQEPYVLPRERLRTWVDVEALSTFGLLDATLGGNKLLFPTKPEARAQLAAWLGPPTKQDLRAAFAHRYKVGNLVLAAVMILVSTPWFMPAWLAPTTADPSALRFDYVLMSWGVSTLVCWVISKLAPHRALFLVDIVVHLAIAAWWAYGIAIGERTWWLIIMVLLMVFGAHVSSKHYRRFATMVAS